MVDTSSAQIRLMILPPAGVKQSRVSRFHNVQAMGRRYDELLAKLQRFRGRVYARDGAIPANTLTADGRHRMEIDERSWHVLSVDSEGEVAGCVRYLPESPAKDFDDLWIRESALANCPTWGRYFRSAVEQERMRAREKRFDFAEVGGLAVAEDRRWTADPLNIILAVCGLATILGGCVGVATATVRHGSAVILRRIGLTSLASNGVELPSYYDARYGCEMEALRFDSDQPNPKYRNWIQDLRQELQAAPVVYKDSRAADWLAPLRNVEQPVAGAFSLPLAGQLAR